MIRPMPKEMAICLMALLLTGCILHDGPAVTSGHWYSKTATSFLNQPGTTRDEAIANLGQPLWQSQESRVLLYVWTTNSGWMLLVPPPVPFPMSNKEFHTSD